MTEVIKINYPPPLTTKGCIGIKTFGKECEGKLVNLWIDNTAGDNVLRSHVAKCVDHNELVLQFWWETIVRSVHVDVKRVASKDNIADDPSRHDLSTMKLLKASWKDPIITIRKWDGDSCNDLVALGKMIKENKHEMVTVHRYD